MENRGFKGEGGECLEGANRKKKKKIQKKKFRLEMV